MERVRVPVNRSFIAPEDDLAYRIVRPIQIGVTEMGTPVWEPFEGAAGYVEGTVTPDSIELHAEALRILERCRLKCRLSECQ